MLKVVVEMNSFFMIPLVMGLMMLGTFFRERGGVFLIPNNFVCVIFEVKNFPNKNQV